MIPSPNLSIRFIGCRQANIQYAKRCAVRVVVVRPHGCVIIIKADRDGCLKLPGENVEVGEDQQEAAEREVSEEKGCRVVVDRECIAMTEEYRDDLHQMSYCCVTKLLEDDGLTALAEGDMADELRHEWILAGKAFEVVSVAQPITELGRFIRSTH
ncbi:NUDIX domain-containing protein [Myriangium duriaei CBS 260.36]|uniref:NUDIX domain-containing protein n=1 Tax=Myriangium duriaei CBS 260.36 TaxID=1168546 RepID=A0A9P4J5L9_9PEZI|nr:NUDIX domain-containing protein [Myriangium duriaei CBS 260.36]